MALQAFYDNERRAFNRLCWLGHQEDNARKVIAVLVAGRLFTGVDIIADVLVSPEQRVRDVVALALSFAHVSETTSCPGPSYPLNHPVWTFLPENCAGVYRHLPGTAFHGGVLYLEPDLRDIPDGDTTLHVGMDGLPVTKTELFKYFSRFGHVWRVTTRPRFPRYAKVTFTHRSSMVAALDAGQVLYGQPPGRHCAYHTINDKTVTVEEHTGRH